jgi:dihydroorotase
MYCLTVAKREPHRLALRRAATSGSTKFFLGTDTAPHPVHDKERDCGCAGIFSAPAALEVYAQVFAEEDALDRFEGFASLNGPRFYGLPLNDERITLRRRPFTVPATVPTGAGPVRPFLAGKTIAWSLDG